MPIRRRWPLALAKAPDARRLSQAAARSSLCGLARALAQSAHRCRRVRDARRWLPSRSSRRCLPPHPPCQQDLSNALQRHPAAHWFGTDEYGRDIFSRLVYGSRITLYIVAS